MDKKMLGVIYGSRSCEHEVSIVSAVQLMRNVDRNRFDVTPIYISQQGAWFTGDALLDMNTYTPFDPFKKGLKQVYLDLTAGSGALLHMEQGKGLLHGLKQEVVARIDCFVPVFHGLHGEDGSLQGVFELANIPYTSTGITGSAVGMDKITMKRFFRGMGYPVLPDTSVFRSRWQKEPEQVLQEIERTLDYPVFVKPSCLGSSIGVSRANDRAQLRDSLELAFQYDRRVLIEKGLDKPIEINCSVLGFDGTTETSALEMPLSTGEVLDFYEKYLKGGSSAKGMASMGRVLDPDIGQDTEKQIRSLSEDIFTALDCKGVVRIDYMIDRETGDFYITEINTIPGSLAYYLWNKKGVSYSQLITRMVEYAFKAQQEKDENSFAFQSDILKNVKLGGGSKTKLKVP
ncbi:MAG: D-alanine--D-alanine ligase [Clostridia bacterium]|nr:D-alanine--D-alanine ligase [Clostridia bacterium]